MTKIHCRSLMSLLIDARPALEPNIGGVCRVTRGLISAMLVQGQTPVTLLTTGRQKPDWSVLIPEHQDREFFLQTISQRACHLALPNKLWSAMTMLRLTSLEKIHSPSSALLFLPNIGFVGKPKISYALLVHDLSFLVEPTWYSWRARFWHKAVHAKELIKRASHLFAVSKFTKRDLIERLNIDPSRIDVLPMGLTPFSTNAALPEALQGKTFLLLLGVTHPRKNAKLGIDTWRSIQKGRAWHDLHLVLVDHQQDIKLTQPLSQEEQTAIHWIIQPSDKILSALLRHASCLLYPSWYEGFGLPLHEAAQFGTPCLASLSSALPETAPHGTVFAPPAKPHLWHTCLQAILDSPQRYVTKTSLKDWQPAAEMVMQM